MPGVKALVKLSVTNRTGQYPEMEKQLSLNLRADRALGIPIYLWMVKIYAEEILHQMHPDLFHVDSDGKLVCTDCKFSDGWLANYMPRNGFSLRKSTNRNKLLLNLAAVNEKIGEFHVRMRVLQRSELNDQNYGFAPPENVYNHDQMPIMLAAAGTKTVDEKGKDVVWVSVGQESDLKRTATLDLYIPMLVMFNEHGEPVNLPRPHIIFAATFFQTAEEFDPEEAKQYHKGVLVSFAQNAWVNEQVHSRGLKECLGPQIERITNAKQKGIELEDNLSSHKTPAIQELWQSIDFKNMAHEFVPENLTSDTQALDHHIFIRYHSNVYKAYRELMVARVREKKPLEMSAKEKRIFLTHVLGNTNDEMARLQAFFQAFVSTGNIVRLDGSQDDEVKMQNAKSYDYKLNCSPELISAAEKKIEDQKTLLIQTQLAIEEEEKKNLLALQPVLAAERLLLEPAVQEADRFLAHGLLGRMEAFSMPLVTVVAERVKSSFIWYGSSVVAFLNGVINGMKGENALAPIVAHANPFIELSFGDYDFIIPEEGNVSISEAGPPMLVFVIGDNIKILLQAPPTFPVKPFNFVRCRNPTLLAVLGQGNVDINACAAGVLINVVEGKVDSFQWLIQPSCWHFLLVDPILRPISNRTGAQTLIRLAFKSFQLKLPFSKEFRGKELDNVTSENIIYSSHKEKYDEFTLAKFAENPFPPSEFSLVAKSKNSWFFEDKYATCRTCHGRGSKACKNERLCKTCCTALQQSTIPPSAICSIHKLSALAAAVEPTPAAPNLDDEEDLRDIDTGIDVQALKTAMEKATKEAKETREAFEKGSQAHNATLELRKKQRLGAAAPVAAAAAPVAAAAAPVAAAALA